MNRRAAGLLTLTAAIMFGAIAPSCTASPTVSRQPDDVIGAIIADSSVTTAKIKDPVERAKALSLLASAEILGSRDADAQRDFAAARLCAVSIQDAAKEADALSTLALAYRNAGDTLDSKSVFELADTTAEAIPVTGRNADVGDAYTGLTDVSDAEAEAGFIDDAKRLAALVPTDMDNRRYAFDTVARTQLEQGDERGAMVTIRSAAVSSQVALLSSIAEIDANKGRLTAAQSDLAEAVHAATAAGNGLWGITQTEIVKAQCTVGDAGSALKTLRTSKDTDSLDTQEVSLALAKSGDLADALTVARSITYVEDRAGPLEAIAEAQTKLGNTVAALQLDKEARQDAALAEDDMRAYALRDIAESQIHVGDMKGADLTLIDSVRVARSMADATMRQIVLAQILGDFLDCGDQAAALKIAHGRNRPIMAVRQWERLADDDSKAGDLAGERQMLRNAEDKDLADDLSFENGSDTLANPSIDLLGDEVADKQSKLGDTEGEAMTFVKLQGEADAYSDLFYRSVALSCIVNDLYGETGDYTTNITYQSHAGPLAVK